ncbi:MAG: hypothetical protein IPP83_16155 [Flavobacteriales bacterium]|nr:hypothetical protein [Flavobacteriales bacterium]
MFVERPTTAVSSEYLNRLSFTMKLPFPIPMLVKKNRMENRASKESSGLPELLAEEEGDQGLHMR